jgi:2-aminoadipate transaminase
MTLPEGVDTGRGGPLFSRALDLGVLFVPGEFCYPNDAERVMPRNTIRLSFGVPTVEQIRCGVGRLAEAIKAVAG